MSDDWMKNYGKHPTRSALNAVAYVDSKSARIEELERELDSRRDIIIKMHDQLAAEKALADHAYEVANAADIMPMFCAAYRKARGL